MRFFGEVGQHATATSTACMMQLVVMLSRLQWPDGAALLADVSACCLQVALVLIDEVKWHVSDLKSVPVVVLLHVSVRVVLGI